MAKSNGQAADKKRLCFVIGPIGSAGTAERKHADLLLNLVVKEVLEKDEFGYGVRRADEDARPGMIGDRVITDVINAELVIADLTDLNPNAFYELGIRHSAQQPTIHMARAGTALPFDNFGHGTIFVDLGDFQSILTARLQLAESARAIGEPDFTVTNPITQANASFKMRESTDPRDQIIVEIQERLNFLEATSTRRNRDERYRSLVVDRPIRRNLSSRRAAILNFLNSLPRDIRNKENRIGTIVESLRNMVSFDFRSVFYKGSDSNIHLNFDLLNGERFQVLIAENGDLEILV